MGPADMNATELIRAIHRHGGDVTVDGDDLNLTAIHPLPTDLLHKLRAPRLATLSWHYWK